MTVLNWLGFATFLLSLIALGQWSAKTVNQPDQYLLAKRGTGLFALTATLVMTELNTSTLIAFSSLGYLAGWKAISLALIFLIGLSFYALTVSKKWKHYNGLSVAAFFSKRYGADIGYSVAVILLTAMAMFSALYIKSLSLIFAPLFPELNLWQLSAIVVVCVLAMTLKGGLISIIATDILSFLAVLLFLPLLLWAVLKTPITGDVMTSPALTITPNYVVSLIVLTMFSYILAPWYGQKVISAKTERTALVATGLSALIVGLLYVMAIILTSLFHSRNPSLENAEMAFPMLIYTLMPPALQGLGLGILFAIGATTLSGVWNAMVTLIVGEMPDHNSVAVKSTIKLTLICASVSYLLANTLIDHILQKMILTNIPIVALSYALLAGFYWKQATRLSVYTSTFVGIFWGTFCYLCFGEENMYTWYWALYGIPLIFASGIATVFCESSVKGNPLYPRFTNG